MAIRDTSVTGSFSEDRDQNVFIGIDILGKLPIHRVVISLKNRVKNIEKTKITNIRR